MTNPNNAVGTSAAYGGRTSADAFGDGLAGYSRGILSGWACAPKTGMKVEVGGTSGVRDVAIAEDNAGNKTTINNISASPIEVTISAAPGANTRIDAIVAYVDNPPQGTSTIVDNYEACGLIAVDGTASSSPTAPDEAAIRTAITADGASGSTAYYTVIAYITVANGTTDITSGEIAAGPTVFGAFSRHLNESQSYTAWTGAVSKFPGKDFDDIGCSYSSSGSITISKAGIWMLTTNIATPGGSGEFGTAEIRVNGTAIVSNREFATGSLAATASATTIVKLNTGDVVDVFHAGSQNQTLSTRTAQNFSGMCII